MIRGTPVAPGPTGTAAAAVRPGEAEPSDALGSLSFQPGPGGKRKDRPELFFPRGFTPLLPKRLKRQVLAEREPVGGEERRKERGLQLLGIPPCFGRGLRWTSGGGSRGKACEGHPLTVWSPDPVLRIR